jgi:hypothetical protein
LRLAGVPVQELAVHKPVGVEVQAHSFVSSTAALGLRAVDCNQVVGFFVPFGGHTLDLVDLVAHAQVVPVPCLSPFPTFLVLVPAVLSPFASRSLCPVPALFLVCLYHSHMDYASPHMQVCHMPSLLGGPVVRRYPPFSQTNSHCVLADGDQIFEVVEEG